MSIEPEIKCTQTLRFPIQVAEKLRLAAKEDRRSVSEQAVLFIEKGLQDRDKSREKK